MQNASTAKLNFPRSFTFVRRLFSDFTDVRGRALRERRLSAQLIEWAQVDLKELFSSLEVTEQGLSTEMAKSRLAEFGPNEVSHEKSAPWHAMLLKNFYNPFIALLCALAATSYFLDNMEAVLVLALMISMSVLMRFLQEYRSSNAADQLKSMVQTTATVTRSACDDRPSETTQMGSGAGKAAWRAQGNSSAKPSAGRYHSSVGGRYGSRRCAFGLR